MLLIRGGTLVDPSGTRRGEILVDGERIAAVGRKVDAPGAEVLDVSGALVIPGGIDPHTHFDLPVGAVRSADDFASGTVAAACGGTTCVIDFAGSRRQAPEEALREWHAKAEGRAAVDYSFHLNLTAVPEAADEARAMFQRLSADGVASVQLHMAHPERFMVDDRALARALSAGAESGVLVCVHAEDGREVTRRTVSLLSQGRTDPRALLAARPPGVEAAAVRRAARLADQAGAPLYLVHLSSATGLREVRAARTAGVAVFTETSPQFLYLSAKAMAEPAEAPNFVCIPPLRGDEDRAALWSGLADGSIDVLSSDHCPFTISDRRRGTASHEGGWADFTEIPAGLPGVETRLSLAYQGVRDGRIALERWVDAISSAPARLFGLAHRKGSLAQGMDADLVVFDPDATRRLHARALHMRTDHSPYHDMEVTGWPVVTMCRGRVVAREGEPEDVLPGWGKFVPRRTFDAARPVEAELA
ncbi:MAG: dihydropyrimidinase [Actinomycetota bacterium]